MSDDSISRQAATQTVLEFIVEYLGGAFDEDLQKKLTERMNALPSAQPQSTMGQVNDTAQSTNDCISRQAAITALMEDAPEVWTDSDYELGMMNQHKYDVNAIKALPSAQPRKKGVWINDCCSICGYGVEPWNNTPYCPNCGVKMER